MLDEINLITNKDELMRMEKLLLQRNKRIEFAKNYHRNTRGEKMDFSHKHLKELYNTSAAKVVIQGSVQSFKSEWIIIDHFASAAVGLSVFFVLPKFESRGSYVQNRVDKCIEIVPEYKHLLSLGGFNNVVMKQFGKGVIKYVGSNVQSDFVEFPADIMYVEEVDDCHADNVEFGQNRLRASRYQFLRFVGNPTIEDVGINKKYKESTMKKWFLECSCCGEPVELDWFKTIVETKYDIDGIPKDFELRDQDWREGRELKMICYHCGDPFDRYVDGIWIPENPDAQMEGYLLTMLMSRHNPISEMWHRFRNAIGDPKAMMRFYTSDLGLPFSSFDSCLTEQQLRKETGDYNFIIKGKVSHIEGDKHPGPCSMGVDVGKWLDVRISHVEKDGTRRAVFIGKVANIQDLINLGVRYNVDVAVMDSQPEARKAIEFQDDAPFYVWLCKYGSEGADGRTKKDKKLRILKPDRTMILDRTLAELKAGRNILPKNFDKIIEGEYVSEMTCSVRKAEEDSRGNTVFKWTKGKDHQRHADVYDYLASDFLATTISVLDGISSG